MMGLQCARRILAKGEQACNAPGRDHLYRTFGVEEANMELKTTGKIDAIRGTSDTTYGRRGARQWVKIGCPILSEKLKGLSAIVSGLMGCKGTSWAASPTEPTAIGGEGGCRNPSHLGLEGNNGHLVRAFEEGPMKEGIIGTGRERKPLRWFVATRWNRKGRDEKSGRRLTGSVGNGAHPE